MKIEGINQRDADYISSFFTKLPLYLYMQSGPNTKNAFSFGRIIPQEKIHGILNKPVEDLTKSINENYLKEFLPRFISANADKTTRQRFKEFLKPDKEQRAYGEMNQKDEQEAHEDAMYQQEGVVETPSEKTADQTSPKQISDEEVRDYINRCFI